MIPDFFPNWKPDDEIKACVQIGIVITVGITALYFGIVAVDWLTI
jgi:hypothetical protein